MKKNPNLLGVLFVLLASGCAYINPLVRNANIVPLAEENRLGGQMSSEIQKSMVMSTDARLNNRVQTVGRKLVQALPKQEYDYKFYVVQNDVPNAFAIPGGSLYVQTGLLAIADDAELAGVMAHEIGHAYYKHPAKSLTRQAGWDYLSKLIFKNPDSNAKALALQIAKTGVINKYGRDDEYQADEMGYLLVKKAGYPSDGLLRFFRKLQMIEGKKSMPSFLSTHPPTAERIARLEALERQYST